MSPPPPAPPAPVVIAFDPGRNLGFAVVDGGGTLLRGGVLGLDALDHLALPAGAAVVVGNGTGSREVIRRLEARGVRPALIDERGSTLEARALYLRDHPPRGLRRLVPRGLRSPPRPVDDYAAYAIALRFLASRPG